MINALKPEFEYRDDAYGSKSLFLKGGISSEARIILKEKVVEKLVLGPGNWVDIDELLLQKANIKRLLVEEDVMDWDVISQLENVRAITFLNKPSSGPNFNKLRKLRYLELFWYDDLAKDLSNHPCLEALKLNDYKGIDIKLLGNLPSLTHLMLVDARRLISLNGFSGLKNLRHCELDSCPKLEDISQLSQAKNINFLYVSGCKKINDFTSIENLKNLNEIIWGSEIESIGWMRNLKSLKYFRLNCAVKDGDLKFLYDLPELQFALFNNKRNFNVKCKEIQKYLESKGYDLEKLRFSGAQFPGARDFFKSNGTASD